jgi:hypothetical protein
MDATTSPKRRVSTRKADARVEEEMDAGQDDQSDQDNGKDNSQDNGDNKDTSKRDAGEGDHKATGGSSGSNKKPDDKKTDTNPDKTKDQNKSTDAGTKTTPAVDAGPRPVDAGTGDAGSPIGNLEDLAKKSPSGRTQATINKFLMTLGSGDAPASSIKEFLTSINDEVNCKMNPLSYECLTACQAVGTTCALCILEDDCRMTMLDICGVTALGGCIPRR